MEWFCEFTDPRLLSGEQLAADCPYAQWTGVVAADMNSTGEFDATFDPLEHGRPRVEAKIASSRRMVDVLRSEMYGAQSVQCLGFACPSEQPVCTVSALHAGPHPVQLSVCWGGEVQQQVFNRLARSASQALRTGPPRSPPSSSFSPAADSDASPSGCVDNWAIPVSFAEIRLRLSAQVHVLPEELDRPELRGLCVTSFSWYSGFRATGGVSSTSQHHRFALFTTEYHSQIRSLRRGATIDDVIAEVLGIVPRLRNIRILMERIEGFPPLQVVATARDCPIPGHATPIDLRAVGGRVCTLNLFPGFSSARISEMILQDCPEIRRPTRDFMLRLPDDTPFQGMPLLVLGPDHIRGAEAARPAPEEPQQPFVADLPPAPDAVSDDQAAMLQVYQHVPDSVGNRHEITLALPDGADCFAPVRNVHRDGSTTPSRTASTTSTTTTTPFDQSLFRRPVHVPGVLEQADILPTGVLTAPGAHIPVAELGLFQLVTRGSAGCTPFLFMVRGCEPVRLDGSSTWTLMDFCASAASNADCIPRRVQVLTSPIPDLLQPQVVVTDRSDDPDSVLLPVDLRAAPGGVVLPVLLRQGMSESDVVAAIVAEIPDSHAFFAEASVGTDFFFQDAAGFVWTQLPSHLQAIQWLVLRRGPAPMIRPPGVPTSTTTTTVETAWDDVQFTVLEQSAALHAVGRAPALPPPFLPAVLSGQLDTRPAEVNTAEVFCHSKVALVEVKAGSKAPSRPSHVSVPPEGPPPDPDRDPRTPPGTARGRSSSRPNNADMIRAAQVRVLPAEVAEAAVYTAPVGAFSWSSAPHGPHTGAFSVFDARRHHTVDRAYAQASLQEIVALAVAHAPFQIAAVQILTQPVQGLPQPQLVLQEAGRLPQEFPLVWDLRGIQEPVLTIRHFSREMRDEALQKLQLILLRDLRAELTRGTLALFDCLGALPMQFPSDLWAMQHVRATALTGPSVPASSHMGPARLTGVPDTTGRGNRPRIGPVRQHPPGLRLTVLRGNHRFSVDCTFDNGAIDTLVFDLLAQHHNQASLPSTFLLVLSGAQPLRMGYYQEVVFVVQDGSQTATVWDGRHLGQELQVNLHPTTQSTCQVLDAEWTNNGWRLFVNGVPEAAAMRHIRVGDYLQPCSGSQCPGVVPLGSLLALCPMLRPYAWPLEVSMTGGGFSASLRKRRKQLGSHRMPEGTARVYGPHHGEIFLQIGTGMTPTALQVDTALHNLDGFPEGLNALGTPTRHPHDADFVTRYRYRQDSTVLTPAPGHAGHLLVLLVHADTEVLPGVPANPRIMLYPQRGLRHGDVLQQLPEPHFVFGEESEEEHVVSDPAGPPPPEPIFVEPAEPIPVLESGDEQAGSEADLPPGTASQQAASSAAPASALSLLQTRATKHRRSIPTPFGRRSLPTVAEEAPTGKGDPDGLYSGALPSRVQPLGPPARIKLDDLLPAPEVGLGFGLTPDMLDFLLHEHDLRQMPQHLPPLPDLELCSAEGWGRLPLWDRSTRIQALYLFTDGSFFSGAGVTGWAVVILGLSGNQVVRIGFCHGTCPGTSAYTGELRALAHARAIALTARPVPTVVASDCLSALQVAFGQASFGHSDDTARALAGLALASTAFGQAVAPLHVRSHVGCAFNGLADALAKGAARFVAPAPFSGDVFWTGVAERVCDWIWLLAPSYASSRQLPILSETGAWSKAACETAPSTLANPCLFQPTPPLTTQPAKVSFRAVQYNCLSLRGAPAQALMVSGLQACKVQVAMFQETRLGQTGVGANDVFWTLSSPCLPSGRGWLPNLAPQKSGSGGWCRASMVLEPSVFHHCSCQCTATRGYGNSWSAELLSGFWPCSVHNCT